jgi:cytochrome c-type biogenesis protein CcmH/NrfG
MSHAVTLEAKRQKLREQIKSNRNDLDLHLQEGHLSLELGDIAGAISAFSRAIQLDPAEPTTYVNL